MNSEVISELLYRAGEATEQVINDRDKYHRLSARELWEKISSRRSTKYEIFISVLRLIKKVLPEELLALLKEKTKKPYYTDELPFNSEKYKFTGKIGSGGQSRVYLLKGLQDGVKSLAMKVFLPKKDIKMEDLIKQDREACRRFGGIYRNLPNIIPETKYIIIRDPYNKNRSAGVALKPFYNKIKDLFDFSLTDLRRMSDKDPQIKQQLLEFSRQTSKIFNGSKQVPDLIGVYNISIVDGKKLIALDPTFMSLKSRINGKKFQERLNFLKDFSSKYE